MSRSYMQMIYIDSDGNGRQTNTTTALETNEKTWKLFLSYAQFETDKEGNRFVLDYYNSRDQLSQTICLDDSGFTAITGQQPKTDLEYREIDEAYWAEARASYAMVRTKAAKRARAS